MVNGARRPLVALGVAAALVGAAMTHSTMAGAEDTTRPFAYAGAFECIVGGTVYEGRLDVTGEAPEVVAPGAQLELPVDIAITLDLPNPTSGESVRFVAGPEAGGQTTSYAPGSPIPLTFAVGATGPFTVRADRVELSYTIPGWPDPEPLSCVVTGDGTVVSIPVELPNDGSLQRFDLAAPATCSFEDGSAFAPTFRFAGVAPTTVAPGETAELVFAYTGTSSTLYDYVTLEAAGAVAGAGTVEFSGNSSAAAQRVTVGPAGAPGTLEVRVASARGTRRIISTGAYLPFTCTITEPRAAVSIAIAGTPVTTTTGGPGTTTTSTTGTSTTTVTTVPTTRTTLSTTTRGPVTTRTVPTTSGPTTTTRPAGGLNAFLCWILSLFGLPCSR